MKVRRSIWTLLVLAMALLLFALPASAADGVSLRLPAYANTLSLTVTGTAPAGSTIKCSQAAASATADTSGAFSLTLQLQAGINTISATATTPAGQSLSWSGTVSVNLTAPGLSVSIANAINYEYYDFLGATIPNAQVTVNGKAVQVAGDGTFVARIYATPDMGADVTVVATDASGNSTQVQRHIAWLKTNVNTVNALNKLSGTVPVGSKVTLGYTKQVGDREQPLGMVGVDTAGHWSGETTLRLGFNQFWVHVTPPSGDPYFDLITLFKPFDVVMPSLTNWRQFTIKGKTLPGYTIKLNDQPVSVTDDGRFTLDLQLQPGTQTVTVRTDHNSYWYYQRYSVTADAPPDPVYMQKLTLYNQDPGAVFSVGDDTYTVDGSGQVDIPLSLQPGDNDVNLIYVTPQGQARLLVLRVTYQPATVIRLKLDDTAADVNGTARTLPVSPQALDGFTYVPLRFLGEVLGAQVDWDGATQTVTYTRQGHVIQLAIGAPNAMVDGEAKPLPAPVRLVNGRTMVPLRFVSENLGAKVLWDGTTHTIRVVLPDATVPPASTTNNTSNI